MNDTIICPNCKKSIPLTEALSHQVQDKYAKFYKIRLEEEKNKFAKTLQPELEKQLKEKMDFEMKNKNNELEELRKQNKNFQEQLLELNKTLRQLRTSMEEEKLNLEKRLSTEQNRIRQDEQKKFEDQYKLKFLEIEKQNKDLKNSLEDAKRKAEQGSQQTQGEVMEDQLKKILSEEFPYDEISDVPKGIRGADLIQIVKNNVGKKCGTILWESKRTKVWTEGWISKLKQDQREIKAELAIIVTQVLPQQVNNFGLKEGIWIVDYKTVVGAAIALRNNLIELSSLRSANKGKEEKKEILWNYLTSVEFKQRVEAIYESYNSLRDELQKEKDWFTKKWAREEKSIDRVKDNLLGMHGDLEGIVGKTLPELEQLKKIESGE
ncbi:MAG: hypothetical protein ACD_12C00266G0004 [uncultured bacterium]|nr:MAG: hypothetical protein ACD_12C00266G0004 [uncultured bacterium]